MPRSRASSRSGWRASPHADVERLLADPGIVRNRLKVESTVANARAVLELDEGFDELLWSFVGGSPKVNRWRTLGELPAETAESKAMSKELKRRGFRFVGPTVCYAFMQAAGLVNDHVVGCFRYRDLAGMRRLDRRVSLSAWRVASWKRTSGQLIESSVDDLRRRDADRPPGRAR